MKIQDIIFLIIFVFLILKRNPAISAYTGIISLIVSIPLFYLQIFFTAQRLTYYAAAFFLVSVIFHLLSLKKAK
ncbi:MAG: hypothetical protein HYT08_01265 [Candidatus Levybacteria bacterium]|nr:hypothetical protein [Candidatus Levybacteria bacterium]